MSYDLYFTSPVISFAEFQGYFEGRSHYQIGGKTAWYGNKDTGVYFSFDYNDRNTEEVRDEEAPVYSVMFNINYFRPSYFALEAEVEVSAFAGHFGCQIDDPQTGIQGDYRREDFIDGWNSGNHRSYQSILPRLTEADPPVPSMPAEAQERIWRWNYSRGARSEAMVEDRFIPLIFMVEHEGELVSFCVWPDALPSLLPEVDRLWIARSVLAPKPLFGKKEDDHCFVPFESMRALLAPYQIEEAGQRAYRLPLAMPTVILQQIRKLKPMRGEAKRVEPDKILTRELMG